MFLLKEIDLDALINVVPRACLGPPLSFIAVSWE
jgi:hypothetical protein